MKSLHNVDLHKYDKNPIPDNIKEIRDEINSLKAQTKDPFLSQLEQQLILDRIIACEDKIKKLSSATIKITPVLGTRSIRDVKASAMEPKYSLTESKLLL